jgi:FlaA1/EpsC-like NDP-sugar epimerase
MIRALRNWRRAWSARLQSCAAPRRVPLDLAELLHRPPVDLNTPQLQRFLAGKRIVVTGAGGSIGSEICRQIMRFCPQRLILLERSENSLFEIDRELRETWVGADIASCLADICDPARIGGIFQSERPQVIFHAAAHKHVPMMELNIGEAIRNNVLGTQTVADAARHCCAAAFVLISTDKAVNPTSVMGATKRMAELYVQACNAGAATVGSSHRTRFVAVRFGNVLGSSGSVVPIFCKQIAAGGPVTVTHPDMQRFFMTIPEASQLVLQAGAIGQGGEIFVLDMGQPIRILELAYDLVERHGLRPFEDIEVKITGIRPGEKLHEELTCDDEQTCPTAHQKIRIWRLRPANPTQVERSITLLKDAVSATPERARFALRQCVPEFRDAAAVTHATEPGPAVIPLPTSRREASVQAA